MSAIDSAIVELTLSLSQLADVRDVMAERVREGLESSGKELAMLPTYLPPPGGRITGEALVVDIGGTNARASRVRLEAKGKVTFPSGQESSALKKTWESAADFFYYQVALAPEMKIASALPLGYCFSYPAHSLPDRDAILLQWTKDLKVPGVIGKRVGKMLRNAFLDRGMPAGRVTVLNDTVAALMGGSWAYGAGGEISDFIGLIVGTGNNMAACFPVEVVLSQPIDSSYRHDRMAINLESGNFRPPHLSRFDEGLDKSRPDSGDHRGEKAISGKYLPELYSFILSGSPGFPAPETKELFRLARRDDGSPEGKLASAIVNRSADLVAASLAGLVQVLEPEGKVGVLAEGSVINKNPDYRKRVAKKLNALIGDKKKGVTPAKLFQLENVNLIGAAIAALI